MSVIKRLKKDGLAATLRYAVLKSLGMENVQEEIDTMYYLIDQLNDVSSLPPTSDPDLRVMQRCDAYLLGIFDLLCRKHGLTYWIEYGTLLGAVRHKGFIPWDDDTDLAMPRADFNKVYDCMHDELAEYGISMQYRDNQPLCWISLSYEHRKTGIWADIAPMDSFMSSSDWKSAEGELFPSLKSYKEYYRAKAGAISQEELWKYKLDNVISKGNGDVEYLFHGQEWPQSKLRMLPASSLVPTSRIGFEGIELNAPAEPEVYLRYVYGDNYMGFPRKGINKHDGGRGALSTWAKKNNVDMGEVLMHLEGVYNRLKEEK